MTTLAPPAAGTGPTVDDYAGTLFRGTIAAFHLLRVYAGDRLGWYRALADDGPATPAELARRTGTQERYCREWLEAEASFGTLALEHPDLPGESPRFALPSGPAEVLTDEHSLAFLGALPRILAAVGAQLENLLEAFRNGGGVSWAELGDDAREAQAALNRPWFEKALGPALAGSPEVDDVLSVPGARIADIGCGAGWSTIALARTYPQARLVGFDIDPPSIDMARAAAAEAGLTDRVSFRLAAAETLAEQDTFDAALLIECLHDMARPVEVLTAVRSSVRPDGVVVVADEAVADIFRAPGDEIDQFMYSFSLFVCLPDGLSSTPSAGTGMVMRRPVLTDYALRAGFSKVSVLPISDFSFLRFYRLHG